MLSRVKMKASALVNISIHAMTLPIVLLLAYAVVLLTTGFEIKYFNIMYRGISYSRTTAGGAPPIYARTLSGAGNCYLGLSSCAV